MPDEAAPRQRKVIRKKKENAVPVFTDHANVTSGSFGFKIAFGNIVESDKETLHVDDIVTVGMSAEHAFALMQLLGEHLEGYGKHVGPIRVAPSQTVRDIPRREAGE